MIDGSINIEFFTQSGIDLRIGSFAPAADNPAAHVAILPGRCEFIEKYAEIAADLAARGVGGAVIEWRAHGLSGGRDPDHPQRHHLDDFALLADDLDAALAATEPGVPPAAPRILLAHSMGALIAALHLARHPRRYAAAVLCAPMFAINTAPLPQCMAERVARAACALGFSRRYAFTQHDYDPAEAVFAADNRLTGDPARFAVLHDAWAAEPRMRLGGVTFGWLRAAFAAMRAVRDGTVPLDRVETPALILSAPRERVVDSRSHAVVARRFRNARVVEFPAGKHELLMERDDIRHEVMRAVDGFLQETIHLG